VSAHAHDLDLAHLDLSSGEGRRFELLVPIGSFELGGDEYAVRPDPVPVRLEVSRMTGTGFSLRLRFDGHLAGPCMRCLGDGEQRVAVEAREVDQPGEGDELDSPYVEGGVLDLAGWARDALALAAPARVLCREDCPGLCPQCGERLADAGPGHRHERAPDPRWAALRELGD